MDAEFVEFLDKKFQTLEKNLRGEIQGTEKRLGDRMDRLEESLNKLYQSVDRFVKLHEDVVTEQKTLRADIDRIKSVIKEKLGVQL